MIKLSKTPDEAIIRSPNLGDTWNFNTNLLINKTMNGTIKTYKGSRVPTSIVNFASSVNKRDAIDILIAFLRDYAGEEITLTSYDSEGGELISADGFVITPINTIVVEKDDCSYSISFSFQLKTPTDILYFFPDPICSS